MKLEVLEGKFAVCRLDPSSEIPPWVLNNNFFNITRTKDELSLVCLSKSVPTGTKCEADFSALKVQGPLDFSLTGILASILNPLAKEKISVFTISTFETDYVLVRSTDLERAITTLRETGFEISRRESSKELERSTD